MDYSDGKNFEGPQHGGETRGGYKSHPYQKMGQHISGPDYHLKAQGGPSAYHATAPIAKGSVNEIMKKESYQGPGHFKPTNVGEVHPHHIHLKGPLHGD